MGGVRGSIEVSTISCTPFKPTKEEVARSSITVVAYYNSTMNDTVVFLFFSFVFVNNLIQIGFFRSCLDFLLNPKKKKDEMTQLTLKDT